MSRTPSGRHERPKSLRARYRQSEAFRFARALLLLVYAATGRAAAAEATGDQGAEACAGAQPPAVADLRRVAVALPNDILEGSEDGLIVARLEQLRSEVQRGRAEGWLDGDEADRIEASVQAVAASMGD